MRTKTFFSLILSSIILLFCTRLPAQSTKELDAALCLQNAFVSVADKVGPAVVSIYTTQEKILRGVYHSDPQMDRLLRQYYGLAVPKFKFNLRGLGSGMIVNEKGDILTNFHVVKDADEIMVTLSDGRSYSCELIGADDQTDVAIIRIVNRDPSEPPLPTVTLGDSSNVRPGQWSIALGNPFGIAEETSPQATLTVGVISAVRSLATPMRDFFNVIQTDAAINPGNSGGPLCNIKGEVIGINTFIVSAGIEQNAGIGFAMPINTIKPILDDLVAGRNFSHGWLGVIIQNVTDELQAYFNAPSRDGALVSSLQKDGPAADAGVKPGDIILTINGSPIRNVSELIHVVAGIRSGNTVDVELFRDGSLITIPVTVGSRPDAPGVEAHSPPALPDSWRGLRVGQLPDNDQFEEKYGILIQSVEPGSYASRAGLKENDVIIQVGRAKVSSVEDFFQAVRDIKGSALVLTERGFVIVKSDQE